MIWGISLVAVIVAGGFFHLGKIALRKRIGQGTLNQWAAFACFVVGGMSAAVATRPLVDWVSGLGAWLPTLAGFGFLALAIGTAIDIGADKKPDKFAYTAAKVAPALLLVLVAHWPEFSGQVSTQVTAYMSQLGR